MFFNIKDDDEVSMEEVEEYYNEIFEELREKENFVEIVEFL